MKKLLFILFCLNTLFCSAQKKLTNSRTGSYYTYLYKLNEADLLKIHQYPNIELTDAMLTHPVDSFKTDRYWKNNLPPGNYAKVWAQNNQLQFTLIENHTAFINLINNDERARFALTSRNGDVVKDAVVTCNNRPVQFDAQSGLYTIKIKHEKLIAANYKGVTNYYKLTKPVTQYKVPGWFKKHWMAFKKLFKKDDGERRYSYNNNNNPDYVHNGFMVFNKPKYKPNDTVRFKAFIVDKKTHKPIKLTRLHVKLYDEYDNYSEDDGKIIGEVKSYAPGAFEYNFVLNDSLDIDLDDTYKIGLEAVDRFRPESDNDADDDADEKEEESKSKVYMAGKFEYEEYELKAINYTMRTDKDEHEPGNPVNVYFKATDENDLPVPDGRVDIILRTNKVSNYYSPKLFVPDTLWKHTLKLEPLGETKLTIPDSVFARADIGYNISTDFYNSANEHRSQSKYLTYHFVSHKIKTELVTDTLKISGFVYGKNKPLKATVYGVSPSADTVLVQTYTLPAAFKINPQLSSYVIKTDSAWVDFALKNEQSGVAINGYRTADSAFIQIANPRHLHFGYAIYAGSKIISQGQADSLFYKQPIHIKGHITCRVYYNWGGEFKTEQNVAPYNDQQLTIKVKQPVSVYQGQKANTEISVSNFKGQPVAGADITAWAITSKFEDYQNPYVPYMGKNYPLLKRGNYFYTQNLKTDRTMRLNWKRWSREAGLDSIEYYRFTHPDTVYRIAETLNATDTITQIAPFVVKNGDIVPVHILYIDGLPVYFSQAGQLQRYSFRVEPGKHNIGFRTQNREIQFVNPVMVPQNRKLILSINADSLNATIRINVVTDTLSNYEAGNLNKYMIRVANTFENKLAVLKQTDRLYMLNPELKGQNSNEILVGPLVDNYAVLAVKDKPSESFITEPGYAYTFLPGLLKQKSYPTRYPFYTSLNIGAAADNYTQYALNLTAVDSTWQNYLDLRSRTTPLFQNKNPVTGQRGELTISYSKEDEQEYFIKNVIFYRNDDPDFIRVEPGNTTYFYNMAAGRYRLLFLLKNDRYAVAENIIIKPNGKNFYRVKLQPRAKDSVSIKINAVINARQSGRNPTDNEIRNDALLLKEAFNEKYLDRSTFTNEVTGLITDKQGEALPGVSVVIKGTSTSAVTNINGRFRLKAPATGKLIIAFIGYETQELSIKAGESYHIKLKESEQHLNEVVVIGYGTQKKMNMTGSIATVSANTFMQGLAGRIPGIIVNAAPGAAYGYYIRGVSTLNGSANKPLIVIDGEIVTEDILKSYKPDEFEEISILKDAAATAIYGSRAANGVLVIVSKKKSMADKAEAAKNTAEQGEHSLRRNFSDYAYWHPKLKTDAEGKASFTTVFPDDITKWRTFVIGVTGNRETGFTEGQVKAYKPLNATFISPQFAVQGDKITAIGKVMNYNAEPAAITRSFIYNGKPVLQADLTVANSKIDTLNVTATDTDSLTFEYTIKRPNGYFDGEQRKIPVIVPGVEETKGVFEVLRNDTTINLKFDATLGAVTLRAEASALPTLMEETGRLRDYRYLCNEQLASKLKGLLVEKRITAYLQQPFKHEKNITEVTKKLLENRAGSGIWGWWKDSMEELWISLHAIEALLESEKQGYKVNIDKKKLTDYLLYQLESYKGRNKITCLELLNKMEAKVDYKKYAQALYKENLADKDYSRYDRLRILLLLQQAGISININDLLKDKKTTMFGNIYWGENSYSFFDNSVQLSVLTYKVLKAAGKHPEMLSKITGYLLEQRSDGGWRNTYESSLILETILPELLADGKAVKPSALKLSGAKNETVNTFPYSTTFASGNIDITKTGTLPVYLTGYQKFWNKNPEKVSKDFTVDTWFEKADTKITKLKGGQQVQLKAKVTARADGDFVMIEIPIPAGCSYESKDQAWSNNEVHREYFKEKVSIFCRKLKQGTYTFTVNLMPRYNGEYTLNPAKAELMYFPVFYGREGMRRVVIGDK
jgi:TonB-dependent SusC/RagA subfamily outer membrane receptor